MIRIHPLGGIGEILPGCALGATLSDALAATVPDARPDDVLVVTSKIVSKAEGRFADLATVQPTAEAVELAEKVRKDARLVQLVLDESVGIVRAAPHVLITRHRTGHVMANAGIDRSNLGQEGDLALLLPLDPDRSAEALREALGARWPEPPAVVVSDSFGRPWRYGTTNVAVGASGFPSLLDRRGEPDRDGRPLEVTQMALGDMIASAAGLAMGEGAEGIPAVLVRGFHWSVPARPAADLIRPLSEDLFR
ncbi:coenzyme F420-0:L-glutamate ligase [Sandaracinobacter sp. RS1-74]|uniref:coenzyme F420-0:L-glutamate ligase n=1 Tax=Sandaracinobacteroides sayramensis TaxID=2913411 RepID=UPI001EDA45D6|nr:coenzyme F420-0:L-glutamate ligase [Sandaracinobacteroides sayramensis]MCG2841098.1 coenzyme F420-0:L-glutamate ligase [Sandaracinobacteroides sayramensis]